MPAFLLASACGSGNSSSSTIPPVVDASSSNVTALHIDVSPALSPSFDPSIHDYAIKCDSSAEVQFTADIHDNPFNFVAPDDRPNKPFLYPLSVFQKSFAMSPGQRFRFYFGVGTSEYSVRCLPKDFPALSVSTGQGTPQAEWYVFAPSIGASVPYVIVTDAHGTPVWWKFERGDTIIDAKILGPRQIAWTTLTPYGANGRYVIRDFDGHILNAITGNIDDHELAVTPSGTYLVIHDVIRTCPPDCADLSPWGGATQTPAIDAEILELDGNSNVLWKWRTRDHIALSESGDAGWLATAGNDIIHMNAVEPDGTEGVFFSARHLNAIYHVTKSTGAIDWKIGGSTRPESLAVIGDVRPTAIGANGQALSGQHDVRLWPDGTVSVHDNGTLAGRPPYIVRYKIDATNRTAEVVEELQDPRYGSSFCCGSARRLAGGHWLVQWGGAPYVTELDSSGSPVLTIQYNSGPAFSYRAVAVPSGEVAAATLRAGMDAMAAN